MAFDEDLARELLEDRDRDHARFFAGRDEEIRSFDAAVREAGRSRQTVFRVFQGAPGAGKTSLLARLREIRSDEVLFVDVAKKHLADDGALAGRVRDAAGSTATKIVSTVLKSIGSTLRMQPAGDALGGAVEDKTVEKSKIVLLMDEAHRVDESVGDVLVDLHTIGLGVPSVFAFAGLGHTASVIRNIRGLSRLARNAEVHMRPLDERDCVDSTRRMLDGCGAGGGTTRREHVARRVASMAFGWPQHLACAHAALARELIRTGGDVGSADLDAVARETAKARHEYYRRRLDGTVLDTYPEFTAATVAAVRRDGPEAPGHLWDLCDRMLDDARTAHPRLGKVSGEEFATALIEKGVLGRAGNEPYDAAIPSMADWLDDLAAGPGRGSGRRRPAGHGGRD